MRRPFREGERARRCAGCGRVTFACAGESCPGCGRALPGDDDAQPQPTARHPDGFRRVLRAVRLARG